jgi:hypothetical protein
LGIVLAALLELAKRIQAQPSEQEEAIAILEKYLAYAREGRIRNIVIIAGEPSGEWMWDFKGKDWTTTMIGRLEIIKQEWINKFTKDS